MNPILRVFLPTFLGAGCAFVTGCRPVKGHDTDDTSAPGLTVEVRVSDAEPTVLVVSWTAPEAVSGTVRFGVEGAYDHETPAEPASTTHETLLLGLPPDADVVITVSAEKDGEPWQTSEVTAHTGSMPSEVPTFTSTAGVADGFSGYTALPLLGGADGSGARMAVVLDPQGQPTWYHLLDNGEGAFRVRVAQDGGGVLYSSESLVEDPDWQERVRHVSWDGATVTSMETPGLHHDFVELPDGTIAYLGVESHDVDGVEVETDTIESVTPDGEAQVLWRAWDHLDALGLETIDPHRYEGDPDATHANHLVYKEDEDAWLITFLILSEVALVDRATGEVRWAMGGPTPDFALTAEDVPLGRIHGADLDGDNLVIFRNDRGDSQSDCSEVRTWSLDTAGWQATRTGAIPLDPCTWVFAFGEVQLVDDGNTQVAWSTAGRIEEYDPTNALAYRVDLLSDNFFGYSSLAADLYAPE